MGILAWLEASGLAEWVRTSTVGYPFMITAHAIGMAVMVGLAFLLDMRLLGMFRGIPFPALHRFFAVARAGFAINFLSGVALFTTEATTYVSDFMFVSKIALVLAGAATALWLQAAVGRDSTSWSDAVAPGAVRLVAVLSILCWVGATITGRLIAYL